MTPDLNEALPAELVSARIRLPEGDTVVLFPGDVIGRLWRADLQLNHPAVSELHAYLSHRDGRLWLLPLRGQLRVHGLAAREVALRAGLAIDLAPDLTLVVDAVHMPDELSALSLGGRIVPLTLGRFTLSAELEPGPAGAPDAVAHCWSTGDGWYLQPAGSDAVRLDPGVEVSLQGQAVGLVDVRSSSAEAQPTQGGGGAEALHLVFQFDTVQVQRRGAPTVLISGLQARALSLLAEFAGPVHWQVLASEIWRRGSDAQQLRRRWDRLLWALRRRLRSEAIRGDLVMTNLGQVELVLGSDDAVEIRT